MSRYPAHVQSVFFGANCPDTNKNLAMRGQAWMRRGSFVQTPESDDPWADGACRPP
jgi:hypothetical protein